MNLVCLDGNGHWALLDGALQRAGALRHGLVARDATLGDGSGAGGGPAASVTSGVWVAGLGAHVHSLLIGEAQFHASAIAALVAVLGAINELLLRERLQLAGADLPSSLHGTSGGESPARAALALVLHWGHCSLGCPVNGQGQLLTAVAVLAQMRHASVLLGRGLVAEPCSLPVLGLGEVSELVEAESQVLALAVLLLVGLPLVHGTEAWGCVDLGAHQLVTVAACGSQVNLQNSKSRRDGGRHCDVEVDAH